MMEDTSNSVFNELLEQYYSAWFRYHPEKAVHVGMHGYADKLTPFGDEDISVLISLDQKLIFALEELNFAALSAAQQLDYRILSDAASMELHDLMERDWRYIMPQKYLPMNAIQQLLQNPVENFHQSFKHRLQRIPEHLRSAKSYLLQRPQQIPKAWVAMAIQGAGSGSYAMRDLMHNSVVISQFENPARLQPLCDEVAHAMEEFEKFLKKDIQPVAEGEFACGELYFNRLLNDGHYLEVNADQLHQFGERLFRQTHEQMEALCRQLPGSNDIDEQLAKIRYQQPGDRQSRDQQSRDRQSGDMSHDHLHEPLMDAYRSRMHAAHNFVVEYQLLTMVEAWPLKTLQTPELLRHEIPFAAYDESSLKPASRNAPEPRGYYYVTPVSSESQQREHNWISIDLACVHVAFPGHHLQRAIDSSNRSNTLPRRLNTAATLYEGWGLYCEDMMQEQGFLDKPAHLLMVLRNRLWCALRVMLDVELHTRNLSIDAAVQRMRDVLGFDLNQAHVHSGEFTQYPGEAMSSAVGWALIRALKEEVMEAEEASQPDFNLKRFHDRLLSVGACALPQVIKHEFGEQTWKRVHARVFSTE